MAATVFRFADGTAVIVCGRGARPARVSCRWCPRLSTALCDFPSAPDRTCDAPMCPAHRWRVPGTRDTDYCPDHDRTIPRLLPEG